MPDIKKELNIFLQGKPINHISGCKDSIGNVLFEFDLEKQQ